MRKIKRNIGKYGLTELNTVLRQQRRDGASLRDLAAFINQRILEAVLQDANASIVGDATHIYETLQGDVTSEGRRAELRARLTRLGVPIKDIEDDFVTHQTVSAYLCDCLDMETSQTKQVTIGREIGTIEWAQAREHAIITRSLTRLYETDQITTAVDDVTETIYVTCAECGTAYRLHELLEQTGCDCTTTEETAATGDPS